jgi:NAD(P)H-hydrate epimerase
MLYVTAEQMRGIDRRAIEDIGIPGVVLMENAGRSVYEEATKMVDAADGVVLVLCGKGNNGGDGYVVARHLFTDGYSQRVHLLGTTDSISGDAATNMSILQRMGIEIIELLDDEDVGRVVSGATNAALIIDALLGTGLKGEVKGPYATLISGIVGSGTRILSVDIPSGLDADTGEPLGVAVTAEKTVTFQYPKLGFKNPSAKRFVGELVVADIGIPAVCAADVQ